MGEDFAEDSELSYRDEEQDEKIMQGLVSMALKHEFRRDRMTVQQMLHNSEQVEDNTIRLTRDALKKVLDKVNKAKVNK